MQTVEGKKQTDPKIAGVPGAPAPRAEAKPALAPAKRGSIGLLELSCNSYRHVTAPGATPEQVGDGSYWSIMGADLHSGDDVKVIAHDRSWTARVEIIDAQSGFVSAALVYVARAEGLRAVAAAKQMPAGWSVERSGPGDEAEGFYALHRESGRKILNSGLPFPDFEAARSALLSHAIFQEPGGATKYLP